MRGKNFTGQYVRLVKACAWCYPKHDEPKLPNGYAYTHGICRVHAKLLKLQILRRRKEMIIGFDFYKTLSAYPRKFRTLISSYISEGHHIVVISALSDRSDVENYTRHMKDFLAQHNLTYHELQVVVFHDDQEIPDVKLEACKEKGVEVYYDDREDVCQKLNENDILAFKVGHKNKKDKSFFT